MNQRRTNNPNNAAKDQAAGNTRQVKGRFKESWGALTGNQRLEAEGRADQMAGATQNRKGQWKSRIKAWIDRL
ncbi:MAG: CsbD family protein [Chloroflexi bacterium]|nr:MAG: CsbD family protein [Chloroflexota bacterium]